MKTQSEVITHLSKNSKTTIYSFQFWHKITTPGTGDLLMNAYVMLLFGIDTVPDVCQQYICTQLRQTLSNIVLINDLNPLLHEFHQHTPNVWPYISIDQAVIDQWVDSMAHCPTNVKHWL